MAAATADSVIELADRLFGAIERGDKADIAALWADDVTVWRSGEASDNRRARALRVIDWFVDATAQRRYQVLDRQVFDCGFVQQHTLWATGRNGSSISARVCIVVKVGAEGLITRIDEYFDPKDIEPLLAPPRTEAP